MPLSLSYTALWISALISSIDNGCNSKITEREISAPFTSKYGFSVVAPIRISVPSSMGIRTTNRSEDGKIHITLAVAQECIQKRVLRYDKSGDSHYDTISAAAPL